MSEKLKHTKGPWIFDEIGLKVIGKNSESVGYIDYHNIKHLPYKANARLIATAPDMLDMLMEIYKYNNVDTTDDVLLEALKNIIEKATGLKIEEIIN